MKFTVINNAIIIIAWEILVIPKKNGIFDSKSSEIRNFLSSKNFPSLFPIFFTYDVASSDKCQKVRFYFIGGDWSYVEGPESYQQSPSGQGVPFGQTSHLPQPPD